MAAIAYNLQRLLQRQADTDHKGKTTWAEILNDMQCTFSDTDFHKFKITATYEDPTTQEVVHSAPLFVYLHNCSFVPEDHHVEHPSTDVQSYNDAVQEALEDSKKDTKIHFVPEYKPE